MSLKSVILKNKLVSLISILFSIWILFLIIITIIGQRKIVFFDALHNLDVSSEYSDLLPIGRYIFEPFTAIAFILEYEFTWLFLFFIFYPILRILYYLFKKKGRFNSIKFNYLRWLISDFVEFCFKIYSLALVVVGLIVLIGYLVQGFIFVNRYFMIPIQLAISICFILMIIKAGYTILKLVHSRLRFKLRSKFEGRDNSKKARAIKETVYIVGIGFILLATNIVLISIKFMPHQIIPETPLDEDEFLMDFHVHTIYSDGWLTPEERVMWYIEQGIDAAFFTDHDNIRGYHIAKQFVEESGLDFVVLIGEEWTDHENDIHMNYFGISKEIVPLESYTVGGPSAMNASDLINYVKSHGGYITVNHYNYDPNPAGGYGVPYTLEQLRDWGVDGFEIVNGGSYQGKYEMIRQFCITNNLIMMGGSDIHTNEDLNTFVRLQLTDPTNFTVANIFNNLKNNTHDVIAVEFYPKVVDFPNDMNDLGFYVFEEFANYILNLDTFQGLSWIIWSLVIFIIFLIGYRKLKKADAKWWTKKFV
ncbi:MAG: PHP domain-containing protein [Candidatus Hermodarchaeota archaeon]